MSRWPSKILHSAFTVLTAITCIFFAFRLAPGDPVERILGPEASDQEVAEYRSKLGLDRPLRKQYVVFLKGAAKGDFGDSLFGKKPVVTLLKERMPPTITLALASMLLSTPLGLFMGVMAARNRRRSFDNLSRLVSLVAFSFPIFSLAPLLAYLFSIKLGLLPVSEWGDLKHMVLPTLVLVIPLSAVVMRVSRNKYLEEHGGPWIQVLHAKGLSHPQVILRLVKVCLPTVLNVVAIQFSVVLSGAMVTETIFDIPGMGGLLFDAIQNRDYPVVQGVITYSTCIYMLVYFLTDALNSAIDPRIKEAA